MHVWRGGVAPRHQGESEARIQPSPFGATAGTTWLISFSQAADAMYDAVQILAE